VHHPAPGRPRARPGTRRRSCPSRPSRARRRRTGGRRSGRPG
jgi:hypothetical protein